MGRLQANGRDQYFVCPVSLIHHRGQDLEIPINTSLCGGEHTMQVKGWLRDIMYGVEQHKWAVVVDEET